MDFTPHTDADIALVLERLGLNEPADLFSHIPERVRLTGPLSLPKPLAEAEVMRLVDGYAATNRSLVCFAGGGVYDHFLPPVVRALTMRSEFVTAYTPYQAEVSQGVLQALYEYQSMVCALTGMEVANASLYDGATAAVEAVNMAVAATKRSVIWVSRALSPRTRETLRTFEEARGIEVVEHPVVGGRTAWDTEAYEPAALVFGQPNYLGVIEEYDTAVDEARRHGALAIAAVDPMTLGLLRTPGDAGCNIAVGEGQSFGNPMSYGGPLVGLLATTLKQVRRIPGRLVGQTVDADGRTAYAMTLRTREQDIRREKASSNICTNQSLNAVAAAIHLAWLGPEGLAETAMQSAQKAHYLAKQLAQLPGVQLANDADFVREFAVLLPIEPEDAILAMGDRGYLAGIPLSSDYPELPGGLLVAVTEQRTREELDGYVAALREVIAGG
jgi:glycine dehydrogenase subunit 1